METVRILRRATIAVGGAALVGAVLTGCVQAGSGASGSRPAPTASAAGTPAASAAPSSSPVALVAPEVDDREAARSTFNTVGPDGAPGTANIAYDTVSTAGYRVEGQCLGESAEFRVITANVDDHGRLLTSGTITCGEAPLVVRSAPGYSGLVQIAFTNADRIDAGWIRVIDATED